MNGSMFSFQPYPQRPSVRPDQIGAALAKMNTPEPAMPSPGMMQAPAAPAGPAPLAPMPHSGFGGPPLGSGTEEPMHSTALQLSEQEAARRLGRHMRGSQPSPAAPFSDQQLRNMGLSDQELRLLKVTGGAK